ncbi:ATP-NAD kinase-like domain-containing protein [Chlamydoabsidia padenii]|nr:ATP-NAD kinase-like domain-containing protein [Chlamydoabsidia padenii]
MALPDPNHQNTSDVQDDSNCSFPVILNENAIHSTNRNQHQELSSSCLVNLAGAVREGSRLIGKSRVKWENPKSVMIITKPKDLSLIPKTRELALWLIKTPRYGQSCGVTVYVDEKLQYSLNFNYKKILKHYPYASDKLKFWNPHLCATNPELFDFIITLGGDGTVLFSSWLFQTHVPPVIPFHLGSLGFLTPFDFSKYHKYLSRVMENGVRINLRGRLTCTIYRQVAPEKCNKNNLSVNLRHIRRNSRTGKLSAGGWCNSNKKKKTLNKFGEIDGEVDEDSNGGYSDSYTEKDNDNNNDDDEGFDEHRQVPCFTTVPVEQYQVMNELVVDRGPSPYVSLLELFGNDKHLTTVQADGLAISTPTGSTAYSLSAGGSLTHPEIRAILITPICPHTLSFRSTMVPDSMELRICVPYNSRNTAWAAFDGRARVEIKQGDHIKITASKHPFPTVCKENQSSDWFGSVQNCLHWNRRPRQKSFAVVESNTMACPKQSDIQSESLPRFRSSSVASSSSSSDNGHDQVFGVFCDNHRTPHHKQDETYGTPADSSDDSFSETNKWTEDEILKSRIKGAKSGLD